MGVIYTFLYLIAVLCSAVLFAPSIVPAYVKWPLALVGVLFIIFLFNLSKKDTKYTTNDTKRKIVNYGLMNPLIIYLAASTYILGFSLIITHLSQFYITDMIKDFNAVIETFQLGLFNNFTYGLIFIVLSIFIFYIRNSFKNNVGDSSLRFRSFWYIFLTIIAVLVGIFSFEYYATLDLYSFVSYGLNLVAFAGIVGLVLLIEFSIKLIKVCKRRKKAKKALKAENAQLQQINEENEKDLAYYESIFGKEWLAFQYGFVDPKSMGD